MQPRRLAMFTSLIAWIVFSLLARLLSPVQAAAPSPLPSRDPSDAVPRQLVTIGHGSGHLRYPDAQKALSLEPGATLLIRPGTYLGLSLGNLAGSATAPITVVCDSNTVFTARQPQPNDFTNIAHARFENFRFENYNSTCLRITGRSHDLLFRNFYITNASGWSFHVYDPAKVFDGTKESAFYNFKWENVVVDGMYVHNHVPQTAIDNSSGYLSRTSSEVCFNTLYRSRKAARSKDPYVATLVDVYGPEVTIKHNLIIEPEADAPFDAARNYVYHLGAGPQRGVVAENNLVCQSLAESGLLDASSFVPGPISPVTDAAAGRVGYITRDHHNRERYAGAAADVGAVERQDGAPAGATHQKP